MLDIIIYNIIDLIVMIAKIHARRNQHLKNFLYQVIKRLKAVAVKNQPFFQTLQVESQALAVGGRLK